MIKMIKIIKNNFPITFRFHEESKNKHFFQSESKTNFIFLKTIYYKEYPRFPKYLLPLDDKKREYNLFKALTTRRTRRNFSTRLITLDNLSTLLYFSSGISYLNKKLKLTKRMYPSAGCKYPLEIYVCVNKKIENISEGIYHYNVKLHALELLITGSTTKKIQNFCTPQNKKIIENSAIIFIITAVFWRSQIKYGNRGYRYILIEAGHLAQNIYLLTKALNLRCCAVGGFLDDKINQLLDLEKENEQVIYMIAVG